MIFFDFCDFCRMNKVFFFSADKPIPLKNRNETKKLIKEIFITEGFKLNKILFIFCSDNYLFKMNTLFLKHNYYTDVITFTLSSAGKPLESEIYISIERIKENAKSYNALYQNELLRVMIHGVLHLCGYTDKQRLAKKIMQQKEDFYLELNTHDPS